jgi:DNA-binding response OmpR family regulator
MASYRVLIVEDEWLIARDYAMVLGRAGHVVVGPVSSSKAALELLDAEQVDLALVDFQLGDQTSASVIDRLTQSRVPFIVATGHSRSDLPVGFSAGAIMAKPVHPADLVALMSRLMAPPGG